MKYTHILWDFNGTLLNDVDVGINAANTLLSRRGLKTLKDLDEYKSVFCFPIIKYYGRLGFDFEKESFADLAKEWVKVYLELVPGVGLYEGAESILKSVEAAGIPQLVLSATELSMLRGQLGSLGIARYFDEVLGLDNIHAYSKVDIAKNWAEVARPGRALLIGDTEHDKETADAAGFDCILISRGHQTIKTLEKTGATVIPDLRDIPGFLT